VLNAVDAVSTAFFVTAGYAKEVNPLMELVLQQGVWYFLGLKLGVGLAIVYIMGKGYQYTFARRSIWALNLIYALILAMHAHIALKVLYAPMQ
jgi:hypothetical protein